MNKKIQLSAAAAFFIALAVPGISSLSAQGRAYGMAGCGLGSMIIGPEPGIVQIFAATTNGSTYNQTSGIITGTSNCETGGAALRKQEQEIFVAVNKAVLEQEMAAGKGEKLDTFANLMGCPQTQTASFGNMTRKEFQKLSSVSDDPAVFVKAVKDSINSDTSLSSACMI